MTCPTEVNDQVVDAATQTHTEALAEAVESRLIPVKQALSNAVHDAQNPQYHGTVTAQAALTQGLSTLYEIDTASPTKGTGKIYHDE